MIRFDRFVIACGSYCLALFTGDEGQHYMEELMLYKRAAELCCEKTRRVIYATPITQDEYETLLKENERVLAEYSRLELSEVDK